MTRYLVFSVGPVQDFIFTVTMDANQVGKRFCGGY